MNLFQGVVLYEILSSKINNLPKESQSVSPTEIMKLLGLTRKCDLSSSSFLKFF